MQTVEFIMNIVLVAVAVVLTVVVAIQKSKSSGLGAAFGGETASASPRAKTASREIVLQRITVVLGIIFAVLALAITIVGQFTK